MTTDRKGTVTGRLTTSEPTFQELPPRDPWGWDGTVRARVADAFRRGDYTSTPGEPLAAALGRLQRAGACVLALPQPGEAARPPGGPLDLDYRHLEERVMAHVLSEPGLVSPEAWAALGVLPLGLFQARPQPGLTQCRHEPTPARVPLLAAGADLVPGAAVQRCPVNPRGCLHPDACLPAYCAGLRGGQPAPTVVDKVCTYCGREGHRAHACPDAKREREEAERRPQRGWLADKLYPLFDNDHAFVKGADAALAAWVALGARCSN